MTLSTYQWQSAVELTVLCVDTLPNLNCKCKTGHHDLPALCHASIILYSNNSHALTLKRCLFVFSSTWCIGKPISSQSQKLSKYWWCHQHDHSISRTHAKSLCLIVISQCDSIHSIIIKKNFLRPSHKLAKPAIFCKV